MTESFKEEVENLGLCKCKFCKHFSIYHEGYYFNCCGLDNFSNDDECWDNCKYFELEDELCDMVKFFIDYK